MVDDENKIRVEFAPGCFDNFEGTQEELEEFIAEITRMEESGEMTKNATLVTSDDTEFLPDEILELLEELFNDPENVKNQRMKSLN